MARESWDRYYMNMAHSVKSRATCDRKHVGAIVVGKNNRVAGTGYNGSPSGLPHCTEVGCLMDGGNHCVRVVHAEVNAVLDAQKRGEVEGGTLYATVFPCIRCLNVCIQAGVKRIVFEESYRSTDQDELARAAGIVLEQLSPGESRA